MQNNIRQDIYNEALKKGDLIFQMPLFKLKEENLNYMNILIL